ncbi:protein snail [Zeugodacus cucurbitae]|uniref:protein snail n=1 Tax=Zeugodacus cucurbitae TaxID=28588 RepID=UPI0023D943F2|nr:protein snail [Zeugodacus cucurbitae]
MATYASNDTTIKYKSCPLKKRPIVYEDTTETETTTTVPTVADRDPMQYYAAAAAFAQASMIKREPQPEPELELVHDEQPQDLSLKRKATNVIEDYSVPAKREYVLDLSKDISEVRAYNASFNKALQQRADSPTHSINSQHSAELGMCSSLLSPVEPYTSDYESDYNQQMQQQAPSTVAIHLRGLTSATSGYTTASTDYKSAFMLAAGSAAPMTALWNAYQPAIGGNLSAIFPSPASSIATSPRSVYSYQQMTPPSSPGSEAGSEPEDLSLRNDIPLPALMHHQNEPLCNLSFNNNKSTKCASKNAESEAAAAANKAANYRYKCDKCNKMYSTVIGLSKHQQFHCPAAECNQDKKQHSCHECGKLYTTIGALKMHIRTHTLPCKCPICGKAFSRPWLLQGHIRTHTGEKPFHCSDCPRSFADRSNLRAHQQTHVEIKKYACKVCRKSFSRMSLLNKHTSSNCTITIA